MPNDRSSKPTNLERAGRRRPFSLAQFALFGPLPLEHETCLFLLVNLADFVISAWLLHAGGFREANRLALWVLQNWGWRGLLAYKFGLVTVICLLAQVIARHRLETAQRLLSGATLLFALVLAAALVLAVLR
jgi:hypothetical protein